MKGEAVDRVPVFPLLMFFNVDRAGMTYRQFATSGAAMAESQILMYERYGVDAITACSDAFRISADLDPDRMVYPEGGPPHLAEPIVRTEADLQALRRPDPLRPGGRMADRVKGTAEMVRAVGDECLVLGWIDMPYAEACSVCGVQDFSLMILTDPDLAHRVLDFLADIVIDFALAQLDAGAPMIGAGDAAASLISPDQFREFALPYERRVTDAVHEAGGLVKLHICGDTRALLPDMVSAGCDLYNVDHLVPFEMARDAYAAADLCCKGNLDPVADLFRSTPERCQARALECLEMARGTRYMLSAGCEIPAGTPDEVFQAFVGAPRRFADG